MNFRVGQRVICIDASQPTRGYRHQLRKGAVYTIAATGLTSEVDPQQLPCVELAELRFHIVWAHRFRPVVERPTSIAIFERMLKHERVDR